MKARLIRIGNSRGVRLPSPMLELYRLREGDEVTLEESREGILIRPSEHGEGKLARDEAYREMADEAAERVEWTEWDALTEDGWHG